ncbi:MAG: hypothetical protein KJ666_07555 [Bacteroidetes bacterium]|nr:hypothetical protein [Bacteroidota bacterium]MBU2585660.1 hypothetical protein [Bacteroidota bacterium]
MRYVVDGTHIRQLTDKLSGLACCKQAKRNLPDGRVCCTSLLCHLERSERSNFFREEMLHPLSPFHVPNVDLRICYGNYNAVLTSKYWRKA